MSFARFGADDSDVYLFPCVSGYYECCACLLADGALPSHFRTPSADAFLAHLDVHTAAGHTVPPYSRDGVRSWAADHPDGWAIEFSFTRRAGHTFAGIRREKGRVTATCPHAHTSTSLARICATRTLQENQ